MLGQYSIWNGNFKIFYNGQLKEDEHKERIINESGNNYLVKNLFKNRNIFTNKELIRIEKKLIIYNLLLKIKQKRIIKPLS